MKTTFILSSVVALYSLVSVDAAGATSAGAGFGVIQIKVAGATATILTENPATDSHFCWTASDASAPVDTACDSAGTETDLGKVTGCSAKNGAKSTLLWKTPNKYLNIVECKADKSKVGNNLAVTVYQKQITLTSIVANKLTIADLGTDNHLCWSAGSSASLAPLTTCSAVGTATDPGTTGCGAKNDKDLTWTSLTASNAYVSVLQCTGSAAVGVALAVRFDPVPTTTAVPDGLTQTVKGGTKIRFTGIGHGSHLCWNVSKTSTITARTCSAKSNKTVFGSAGGCSDAKSNDNYYMDIQWDDYEYKYFSVIQCNDTTAIGSALTLQLTEAQISFPDGTTQSVKSGGSVAVHGVGLTQYVCWTSGPFATTPIALCNVVGTASQLGADGCGGVGKGALGDFTWNAANPSVSMIQCNGIGTSVGTAISLTLSEKNIAFVNGDTQSLTFDAGAPVTVSNLGSGNYLCWTSGQTLTEIKGCAAAAGTDNDVGVSGCGGAGDGSFSMLYNSTKKVSMIECSGGEVVGNAISLTLSNAVETQLAETKEVKKVVDAMTTTLNVMNVSVSIVPLFLLGVFGSLFALTM